MFKVQRRRCRTCIYRKDSVFDIEELEDEARDPHVGFASYRACHHVKSDTVCCRGFWDAHRDEFAGGQIAQRLNLVQFVDIDDRPELTGPLGSRRGSPNRPRAAPTAGSGSPRAARKRTEPR